MSLYNDAKTIMGAALKAALPDTAVKKALDNLKLPKGKLVLVSIGKASWHMAKATVDELSSRGKSIDCGVVITKHGHGMGEIPPLKIYEAGHPIPDKDTVTATRAALKAVEGLGSDDAVIFVVSGGGSTLFEDPKIPLEELQQITKELLEKGSSIVESNTIRKRLSNVKAGRFALKCAPAKVFSIVLSDVIGDPLDMIASGPAYPDSTTEEQALEVAARYGINLSNRALEALKEETPGSLENVETWITGSVRQLCVAAEQTAKDLGYEAQTLTASLQCEAREAGSFIASIAQHHQDTQKSLAFIMGGETVVKVVGTGMGGRNQEIALSAAIGISGLENTCVFSLGSDGTDGPTDAAGGYADQDTLTKLSELGIDAKAMLDTNGSYHALKAVAGLVMTGPTGTNVNDLTVLLIKR